MIPYLPPFLPPGAPDVAPDLGQVVTGLGDISQPFSFGTFRTKKRGAGPEVSIGDGQVFSVSSFSINESDGQRNTATFVAPKLQGDQRPIIGSPVAIYFDGVLIFAGSVDSVSEKRYAGDSTEQRMEYQVQCVDYNQLADRFLVASSFEAGLTFRDIVLDLMTNYLGLEGVTEGEIATGPTLGRVVYPYMPVAQCFNELANLVGWSWNIDYNKKLYFRPPASSVVDWTITEPVDMLTALTVKRDRSQYRNVQDFVGGQDVADTDTEQFQCDGVQRTFSVGLPIAESPVVNLVYGSPTQRSPQLVGVKGVDRGATWYWNRSDPSVTLDAAQSPPDNRYRLEVAYRGFVPIFLSQEDPGEIAARQAIEGGSGRYEFVEKDSSIESAALGGEKAQGLLKRFGVIPVVVDATGHYHKNPQLINVHAGSSVRVTLPAHGVDDLMLVQSVSIRSVMAKAPGRTVMGELEYQVNLVNGQKRENFAEFMGKLIARGRQTTLRENEIFAILRNVADIASPPLDSPVSPITTAPNRTALVGIAETSFSELYKP